MKSHLLLIFLIIYQVAQSQELSDNSTIEMVSDQFKKIHLHNYRGKVEVNGSKENKIILEISRSLKSASTERLEAVKDSIYFDSMFVDGHLYLFIQDPERRFLIDENGRGTYNSYNVRGSIPHQDIFGVKYDFDLKLTIPSRLALDVSNHEKDINVRNFEGPIWIQNHHDGIFVKGAANNVKAESHHGDIEIEFKTNPLQLVEAETHHGDIRVSFQSPLSAEVSLASRHGAFFTDFDWQPLPIKVSQENTENGTRYKIGQATRIRIGAGDAQMNFQTYHGDVYIALNK
jgi:hypothetical protein